MKGIASGVMALFLAAVLSGGLSGCSQAKKDEFHEAGQEMGEFAKGGAQKMGEGADSAGEAVQPGVDQFKSFPGDTSLQPGVEQFKNLPQDTKEMVK